jgi:two-component system sensor histidine kinase KdpD
VGASDNLMNDKAKISTENKTKLINEISVAAFRLNHLVDNLLNMQRLESGLLKTNPDWCDITELINRPINRLHTELSNRELKVEIEQGFPLIKLDFGLIEQSIFNILHNAVLYTPPNSSLSIVSKFNNGFAIIVIADEGAGFSNEEKEKLFTKFYRASNTNAGGTGLGLSISKGFIEAHKGTLAIEDNIPKGARFIIKIPVEFLKLDQELDSTSIVKID